MSADNTLQVIFPAGPSDTDIVDRGLVALTEAIEQSGAEVAHGFLGGEYGYGAKFENDVFWMVPAYQDAECSCGHSERASAWHEANPHLETCYYKVLHARERQWKIENNWDAVEAASSCDVFIVNGRRYGDYDSAQAAWHLEEGEFLSNRSPAAEAGFQAWRSLWRVKQKADTAIAMALCRELDIPWNDGRGSAVHCTCGTDARGDVWFAANKHARMCPVVVPNFWHKRTGAEVRWYKYIGRDQEVTAPDDVDWNAIFSECLASLRRK